ncbi:MAG: hypothetical protein QGI13_17315 [Rhodospirillales bacterium]|jgi:hypothetical protein|nr:hypothetical protein [Rhodospirillales bacterium]
MLVSLGPAQANGQCEALAKAAFEDNSGRVAALVAAGVSVNCSYSGSYVSKDTGKTVIYTSSPLQDAVSILLTNLKAVRLLLRHGVNVNLKDGKGETPLDRIGKHFFFLEMAGGTNEEFDEAEAVERLLKQAGGVHGR